MHALRPARCRTATACCTAATWPPARRSGRASASMRKSLRSKMLRHFGMPSAAGLAPALHPSTVVPTVLEALVGAAPVADQASCGRRNVPTHRRRFRRLESSPRRPTLFDTPIELHPMHPHQRNIPSPRQVLHLLRVHVWLWLVPAVLIAAVVGVYAVVHQATWEASQALIVRNEASNAEKDAGQVQLSRGNEDRPGDDPGSGQEPQRVGGGVARSRAAGRLRRSRRLAHRPRHRRRSQAGQARSAQGRRVRQDRSLLSRRAGGRPRPIGGAERGHLQATSDRSSSNSATPRPRA